MKNSLEPKRHRFEVCSVPDIPANIRIPLDESESGLGVRVPRFPGADYSSDMVDDVPPQQPSAPHTSSPEDDDEDAAKLHFLYDSPVPEPPEGGYGWVVVAASFLINFLVEGVTFSFPVFFYHLLEEFGASASKTVWCGSLLGGFCLLAGPFASALANRFGCRKVTIGGSIVACVAFVLSTYAQNITVMMITYGVLGGIGFGLMYLPAVIIVGLYFHKRRALATGIAVCGTGMGTLLFPRFTQCLIEYYKWRGALLLTGGFALHGVVLGALFQLPPRLKPQREDWYDPRKEQSHIIKCILAEKERVVANSQHSLDNVIICKDNTIVSDPDEVIHPRTLSFVMRVRDAVFTQGPHRTRTVSANEAGISSVPNLKQSPRLAHIRAQTPSPSARQSSLPRDILPPMPNKASSRAASPSNFMSQQHVVGHNNPRDDDLRRKLLKRRSVQRLSESSAGPCGPEEQERLLEGLQRPLSRNDIFLSRNGGADRFGSNPTIVVESPSNYPVGDSTTTSRRSSIVSSHMQNVYIVPKNYQPHIVTAPNGRGSTVKDGLNEMLGTSMLKSLTFIILCIAGVFAMLGFFIPIVFLPGLAMANEIDEDKQYWLISILGIANTIGRILAGLLADQTWANPIMINNVALLIAGVLTMLMPLCETFPALAAMAWCFGVCIAAFVSLRSIVIVELFGIHKLTNGFGLLLMFLGCASLVGTPMAGAFMDLTEKYDTSFYLAGGLIALSGVICFPIEWVKKWELRRWPDMAGPQDQCGSRYYSRCDLEAAPPLPPDDDDYDYDSCVPDSTVVDSGYITWDQKVTSV